LHAAEELAPDLLSGQPAAAAGVGDDEVERRPVVRRTPRGLGRVGEGQQERLTGERRRCGHPLGRADDLHVAAPPSVETEVALALVERPEARVLAEEAHRRERIAAGGRRRVSAGQAGEAVRDPQDAPRAVALAVRWQREGQRTWPRRLLWWALIVVSVLWFLRPFDIPLALRVGVVALFLGSSFAVE
jgi:hypothetical protein